MWAQMKTAALDLRPDNCKVIFSRSGEDVISARLGKNDLMSQLAYKQIQDFLKEGFSVAVFRNGEVKLYLKENHTKDYVLGIIKQIAEV